MLSGNSGSNVFDGEVAGLCKVVMKQKLPGPHHNHLIQNQFQSYSTKILLRGSVVYR